MKRMRLKNKSGWTKTEKKQAVKKVKALVKEGLTLNQARISVAAEYNVTKAGVTYWEKTVNKPSKTTTVAKTVVTNTKAMTTKNSDLDKVTQGLSHLQGNLSKVFDSLINKDGEFNNSDASAISSISSNILTACKQSLLERKYYDSLKRKVGK
tara:strand:- start:109 stop:567 length:459 start_codon:yes stop_codon:yes gene_type:complete